MLTFPSWNPVAFSVLGLPIHWYGLAYIAAVYFGGKHCAAFAKRYSPGLSLIENATSYVVLGILLGGRLGYILFYDLNYYLLYPLEIIQVWKGGMAFHGGLIGALIGLYIFSRSIKKSFLSVTDLVSVGGPLAGIFIRFANFINGELYGRPTAVPWGMIFPKSYDGIVRHPSQLYEMFLEGFILYALTNITYIKKHDHTGFTTGVALFFYGTFRFIAEFFREPDGMIGFLSKGQVLSIPLILIGGWLILKSGRRTIKS